MADYFVWLVCLAFYVADCLVRLRPDRLILEQRAHGIWHPVVPAIPEQPRSRRFGVMHLLTPGLPAVSLPWLSGKRPGPPARRELRELAASLLPLGLLAQMSLLVLAVAGPVLTAMRGLQFAILFAIGWHLVATLALAYLLFAGRRQWRMTRIGMVGLWFECVACPGYMANVCRRLATRLAWLTIDGDQIVSAYSRWQDPRRLTALDAYAQELQEDGDLSEEQLLQLRTSLLQRSP